MESTEKTSADNNNPPSGDSSEGKQSSANTEKESGFECNVS